MTFPKNYIRDLLEKLPATMVFDIRLLTDEKIELHALRYLAAGPEEQAKTRRYYEGGKQTTPCGSKKDPAP